tara:strand:- start:9573 stop:9845 length:273 start_codon:yes stop_codon:yes gene_type:complete
MAGPMDMMGPPPGGDEGPMGPPPSMGGEGKEPTVDDLISALRLLPMETRQQIASEIVSDAEGAGEGPPPSMGAPGGAMEEIAKARVGGPV